MEVLFLADNDTLVYYVSDLARRHAMCDREEGVFIKTLLTYQRLGDLENFQESKSGGSA